MVELNYNVEVATIDDLQWIPLVAHRLLDLLTSRVVFDVVYHIPLDVGPCVTLLDPCQNFSNALVAHSVVCAIRDSMLVQLRHHYHARAHGHWLLLWYLLHAKNVISVNEQ